MIGFIAAGKCSPKSRFHLDKGRPRHQDDDSCPMSKHAAKMYIELSSQELYSWQEPTHTHPVQKDREVQVM